MIHKQARGGFLVLFPIPSSYQLPGQCADVFFLKVTIVQHKTNFVIDDGRLFFQFYILSLITPAWSN